METSFPPFPPGFRFVKGHPAVLYRSTLIIADVHLGIERELWKRGVRIGDPTPEIIERTQELLDLTKPKRIVVLGDLKHGVLGLSPREREVVSRFLSLLSSQGEVVVVKGNHDGGIEEVVDTVPFFREGKVGMLHGHTRLPPELDTPFLLLGHLHPSLTLLPSFLSFHAKAFFLARANDTPALVLPAHSPLITGSLPLSSSPIPLSPPYHFFLLDGTYVSGELLGKDFLTSPSL